MALWKKRSLWFNAVMRLKALVYIVPDASMLSNKNKSVFGAMGVFSKLVSSSSFLVEPVGAKGRANYVRGLDNTHYWPVWPKDVPLR